MIIRVVDPYEILRTPRIAKTQTLQSQMKSLVALNMEPLYLGFTCTLQEYSGICYSRRLPILFTRSRLLVPEIIDSSISTGYSVCVFL